MADTIAAISTAIGVGAISIIRVSGKDSIDIVNKIFDRNIKDFKNRKQTKLYRTTAKI